MPFAFDSPIWLILLVLLPLLWVWSYKSLSGLGGWRRILALTLRSAVVAAIVLALADTQYRKTNEQLTVVYLLDQSASIPIEQREAMVRYVNEATRRHMRTEKEDQASVVAFGRSPEVEVPLVDFPYELPRVESQVDGEYTNLAAAMRRAMALFPPDSAKRVVLITDGNENQGDALREARSLVDKSVSIDALPVPLAPRGEVSVDKVVTPADARRDQPFELRVVLDNQPAPGRENRPVDGRLRIVRKSGEREQTLSEDAVTLPAGKTIFRIPETIESSDFYTYEARFTPNSSRDDASARNNTASSFTHVRGKGQVLLIEDFDFPGEFDTLVAALREEGIEVSVMPSNQLFGTLSELQRFDAVVLANVPRSSGFTGGAEGDPNGIDTSRLDGFTDKQIEIMVRNTEELGCGLVMLGGDRSFGAGDWTGTELEKAMPVDFRIKAAKVTPVGALAMIMHACEFAKGNYWQKVVAREAVGALGPRDYAGVIQWNGTDQWQWGRPLGMIPVGPNRQKMMARIDRLVVGDMPQFDPAMKVVASSFSNLNNPTPAIKHCIIISDGDPSPPSNATMQAFIKQKIKITTVAVGALGGHGDLNMMQRIANQTGGKFYVVKNPKALPRIYQREARRVAQPIIRELSPPKSPIVLLPGHEMLEGVFANDTDAPPPIRGYVQTSVKDSSLVNVIMRSPEPPQAKQSTVLATWPYGLGKTVAFTTDAGARWADQWTGWESYDRLFSQMIRWSMRPTGDTGNFNVVTEVIDGKTKVIIDAIDKSGEFLNAQSISATAVGPNLESIPLVIDQTAPGRYIGQFDSEQAGSYLLVINPGSGQGVIRTGVNVGYSDEFRDRVTNEPLLTSIANLEARGGKPGRLIGGESGARLPIDPAAGTPLPEELLAEDVYRRDLPPAEARQSVWPWLVLIGSVVFVGDIFVRRVQFGFEWFWTTVAYGREKLFGTEVETKRAETMSRLRSKKKELRAGAESQAASTRFELPTDGPVKESPLDAPEPTQPKPRMSSAPEKKEEPKQESYTERLLKAKKKAQRDRDE